MYGRLSTSTVATTEGAIVALVLVVLRHTMICVCVTESIWCLSTLVSDFSEMRALDARCDALSRELQVRDGGAGVPKACPGRAVHVPKVGGCQEAHAQDVQRSNIIYPQLYAHFQLKI